MRTHSEKRDDQAQIVKTFGDRMIQARELCGISQQRAAELLGYANSSKLAKIEAASDTNSVPLWLIPKAAEIFGVSVDFLFGVSDDWDRDPIKSQERQVGQWLEAHWKRAQEAQADAFKALHAKQVELSEAIARTKARAKENLQQVERVRELNPEFDELKGGAKLLRLLTETAEEAMGLGYELNKLRALSEAEQVIDDVLSDHHHPAIDRKHPDHQSAKQALDELKSNIDESRASLGVERGSAFEKIEKNIKWA
jgi:transcriptional regulator with XRE-family HTH domain